MSEFIRRRTWTEIVLFAAGALLIGNSLYSNFTHTNPPELRFELTIDKAGHSFDTRAEGSRKLYGKQFYFEGERVTFLGEIDGARVTITGTVLSDDEKQRREFKAEGTIAEKRMVSSIFTEKGSKIGRFELLF